MTTLSLPMPKRTSILAQGLAALFLGLLIFLGCSLLWVVGYQLYYAGRIFPGVSVAGVDLSGLGPQDAAFKLGQTLTYPIGGKVVFKNGDKTWTTSPVQLGMVFDASASAQAAYGLGRSGGLLAALSGQIRARGFGDDVAPVILFDHRVAYKYLQGLAQQVNVPSAEASLQLDGANVLAQPGQIGHVLDVESTLDHLSGQLQSFRDGEVPLVFQEVQPSVADISAQAETARQILSEPLQLLLPNPQADDPAPWVYQATELAKMIAIQTTQDAAGTKMQVGLSPGLLRKVLSGIASQVNRPASSPRFHFDEAGGQLVLLPGSHSETGRTLDVEASANAIAQALLAGQHSVDLVVKETQPAVSETATAKQLGITGLLPNGVQTSYFWGSHAERIQNIQTAAARFDGVLVAPGETFSMGEALGDVSLDNGFTEALIIYGGHTIKGVGGGVCQVSTTLFRTAFFTGFPVVERVPHAYRVSYYEETSGGGVDPKYAGLDATVYFPLVDFKFTNDSAYWILMETSVDLGSRSLTWKFYSTFDGRSVQWDTTGPTNIVPAPAALFKENPDLTAGQITQTDYAANGADVNVTRTVTQGGAVRFQDNFQTHYEAWQAVCEYAPGLDNPEKAAKRKNPPLCQSPQS